MGMDLVHKVYRYLLARPAYRFVSCSDTAVAGEPRNFSNAWLGVMALSLVWGLLLCGVWSLAALLFGSMSDIPALLAAAIFALYLYRRALVALAEVFAPRQHYTASLILAISVVTLAGIFLSLRGGEASREMNLPFYLQWLRPYERHYRLLLLAPLWGGWAMLIAPKFARTRPPEGTAANALAAGCEPFCAAMAMALPLAGSLFYFQYLHWSWQLILPGITILAALGSGALATRLAGLDRPAMLAANVLTQAAFLLTYLAARHMGMRY